MQDLAQGFADLSRHNTDKLEIESAKGKAEKKAKLKNAISGATEGNVAKSLAATGPKALQEAVKEDPKTFLKKPITKTDINAIHKAHAAAQVNAQEKERIALVRKLHRYQALFPQHPAFKGKKGSLDSLSFKEAGVLLASVRAHFSSQASPQMTREFLVRLVQGAETLLFSTGANEHIGVKRPGGAMALGHALEQDPQLLDPELREMEAELGDWFQQPLYVRLGVKVVQFWRAYSQLGSQEAEEPRRESDVPLTQQGK